MTVEGWSERLERGLPRLPADEGYRPTVDGDGDVSFKYEGGSYYIDIDTDDNTYFRLVFPNFWSLDDADERARGVMAADAATRRTNVAKVYTRQDGKNVSAAVEMFLPAARGLPARIPTVDGRVAACGRRLRRGDHVACVGRCGVGRIREVSADATIALDASRRPRMCRVAVREYAAARRAGGGRVPAG